MSFSRPSGLVISMLVAAGAIVCLAQRALAQQCETTADCPKGYECAVVGGIACAQPACPPGETCEPVPCRAADIRECQPVPCKSDADCAEGMVCYTQTSEECPVSSVPACVKYADGGFSCPDAAITPPECKTVTESACTPKWMLPCTKDADCGAGFKCKEQQSCWCSGSAGVGVGGASGGIAGAGGAAAGGSADSSGMRNMDAGAASGDVPVPVDAGPAEIVDSGCGCQGTGEYSCEMQEITCTSEGDCPTGWTCEQGYNGVISTCAIAPAGADGGVVSTCVDAGAPEPAPKYCMPPYSNLWGVRGVNYDTLGGQEAAKGGTGQATAGGGGGSGGTTGSAAGAIHATDASAEGEAKSSGKDSGGCQIVLGRAGSANSALFLAGLVTLLGLRRRRRG